MPKTKKKVSMNVIHILKSVMDYKVQPLRNAVTAGKYAAMEEPVVCEYIASLQNFINNSRYDRSARIAPCSDLLTDDETSQHARDTGDHRNDQIGSEFQI